MRRETGHNEICAAGLYVSNTYMVHIMVQKSKDFFRQEGVRLTIRIKGDRTGSSIPETTDRILSVFNRECF